MRLESQEEARARTQKVFSYISRDSCSLHDATLMTVCGISSVIYLCEVVDGIVRCALEEDNLYEIIKATEIYTLIVTLKLFTSQPVAMKMLKEICDFCPEFYDLVTPVGPGEKITLCAKEYTKERNE